MAAKILILCAFFGVMTAQCDPRNVNVELLDRIVNDITFVKGVNTRTMQVLNDFYPKVNDKTKKIENLKQPLLTSIDQIEALLVSEQLDEEELKNTSTLINSIYDGVAKCIVQVQNDFFISYGAYVENHNCSRAILANIAESVKGGYCNTTVLENDECHKEIEEKCLQQRRIAELKGKVEAARVKRIVSYFAENPAYRLCLDTFSILPKMRKWDRFIKHVEEIFKKTYDTEEVSNETKSKMKNLLATLIDTADTFVVEIKTWTQGNGQFTGSFYFDD